MVKDFSNKEYQDIFQNALRLNARSMSVKTILSERNLRRINYSPYYQRNYVWDSVKQTFFIESVILGTEIPPLILFRSGNDIEVIDGRQRFETLKKYKENEFSLKVKGLKELQVLKGNTFNKLSSDLQDVFLDSNIRVFEFEIMNRPDLNKDVIDKVKKEIFRRYNTGITPLNRAELDNAKYDKDDFSDMFKIELRKDYDFLKKFNSVFFPKETVQEIGRNGGLIAKNVDFIRKYSILHSFPITVYARGKRTEILDLLYDFAQSNSTEEEGFEVFKDTLDEVIKISLELSRRNGNLRNKLISECLLWLVTIFKKEELNYDLDVEMLLKHYSASYSIYNEDSSHYYSNIIRRFTNTAELAKSSYNIDITSYIRDESFKGRIDELRQTEIDAAKSIEELSNLRLNKPNPISTPIDEIRMDLNTNRYKLRPSYQRQEKINITKASSIIESILLGINLPPIFIYKRNGNVKEVVDGQQRLLSILAFLGEKYYNEDGEMKYSKNNNFKLKGLNILTDLEGLNYSGLPIRLKDKLLDFVIDLIIIEETVNDKFDPIDLFIRLNYKPYPIAHNSFEMWNSIVNREVTGEVKKIATDDAIKPWFFLRETKDGQPDRMLNEELITILAYLSYELHRKKDYSDIIGFFPRRDRITCRLKNKNALSDFLINEMDINELSRRGFLKSLKKTKSRILLLKEFLDFPSREAFNTFLNVKKSQTFRRSLQDFYVIWIILEQINEEVLKEESDSILKDISSMLSLLRNTEDSLVTEEYMRQFNSELERVIALYSR